MVDDAFKIQGKILEISETKKDEAKEVYISIGSDHGVGAGTYFEACLERTIQEHKSFKLIGELKVKNVESENLTLCEVKKGGKEIKAAIDGGQTVIVRTKNKGGGLLDKAAKAANSL